MPKFDLSSHNASSQHLSLSLSLSLSLTHSSETRVWLLEISNSSQCKHATQNEEDPSYLHFLDPQLSFSRAYLSANKSIFSKIKRQNHHQRPKTHTHAHKRTQTENITGKTNDSKTTSTLKPKKKQTNKQQLDHQQQQN
ncbi:hypothetical protein CY35_02G023600 [Sphagnum magellanicum]|nr:hypothetical protein CY35_02G023600 [Sphagnum magellanicum]